MNEERRSEPAQVTVHMLEQAKRSSGIAKTHPYHRARRDGYTAGHHAYLFVGPDGVGKELNNQLT